MLAYKYDEYFDKAECDHIDRNTMNNNVENLRWVSHSANCKNRTRRKCERDRLLYLVYDNGEIQMYGHRQTTNIPSATLSRILSGKHSSKYKCIGFYWDRLHEQTTEVKQLVTDWVVNNMTLF